MRTDVIPSPRTLRATVVVAAALVAVLAPSAASAVPADSADVCKDGGYVSYIDPVSGRPFVNQGSCVSFVRHGGTLAPVDAVKGALTFRGALDPTKCYADFVVTGFTPGETVVWTIAGTEGGRPAWPSEGTWHADENGVFTYEAVADQNTVITGTFNDHAFSRTASCVPLSQ